MANGGIGINKRLSRRLTTAQWNRRAIKVAQRTVARELQAQAEQRARLLDLITDRVWTDNKQQRRTP